MTEYSADASQVWGAAFTPTDQDIDFISNLLLDEGAPMRTDQLALAVIRERMQQETRRRARLNANDSIYVPRNRFAVGDSMVFPALGFLHGKVTAVRPGENPALGAFEVIQVDVEGSTREFAAGLAVHKLNDIPLERLMGDSVDTPEEILSQHGAAIQKALETRLARQTDIVKIAESWFPRALLAEISAGHLNLAEAVLDVAGGTPAPTSALLEHVDLPKGTNTQLAAFSLEYALYQDERFDEVGPAGEMAWCLKRLEPPEVIFPPRRLAYELVAGENPSLTAPLQALARELEDEWGVAEPVLEEPSEATLILTFPHWRVGTLPLNARLAALFPHAHQATRIRFDFVDAETGNHMPGWVVSPQRFVFGLADWYRERGLLPGGILRVRKTENPAEVVVEAASRRPVREWVRTAAAAPGGRLTFSMQKQALGVEYDELSIIAVTDLQMVDDLWLRTEETKVPLQRLVADIFRQLAKLNPQSTVHARTLYNAVNVIRRLPPVRIFSELVSRPYYVHVGDLYHRFDEAQWTEN